MKKIFYKKLLIVILIVSVVFATACSGASKNDKNGYTVDFVAMDAPMTITAYGDGAEDAALEAKNLVLSLDDEFNAYNYGSDLGRLNEHGNLTVTYSHLVELLQTGVQLSASTNGNFDLTILPISELWNIGHDDARVPSQEEISTELLKVGYRDVVIDDANITLKNDARIDLGGIAKGYAADQIAKLFEEKGITDALVGLSGNIYAFGKNEEGTDWQIGLQDPLLETSYIGVVSISDTSVVTSGAYQRFSELDGVRYGHIFDPSTGYPVDNDLLSVSVVSKNSTLADAYSTALFVMGLDRARKFQENYAGIFDAIFVTKDKRIICTEGIKDQFMLSDESGRYSMGE
jgi:thiamine biosynthesis lipoprotein